MSIRFVESKRCTCSRRALAFFFIDAILRSWCGKCNILLFFFAISTKCVFILDIEKWMQLSSDTRHARVYFNDIKSASMFHFDYWKNMYECIILRHRYKYKNCWPMEIRCAQKCLEDEYSSSSAAADDCVQSCQNMYDQCMALQHTQCWPDPKAWKRSTRDAKSAQ